MKRILPILITISLFWIGCTQNNSAENKADQSSPAVNVESNTRSSEPEALKPLPPVVEDPPSTDRKLGQAELQEVKINRAGIQLKVKLPPDNKIEPLAENAKALKISADQGSFQMIIQPADIAPEDLQLFWKNQPPVGSFRQFIVNGRGGILAEVEREGRLDYHVDYLYRVENNFYRIHTPFDGSFSRMQATKIFNVCRQIKH